MAPKFDVYTHVTDTIIAEIEAGTPPVAQALDRQHIRHCFADVTAMARHIGKTNFVCCGRYGCKKRLCVQPLDDLQAGQGAWRPGQRRRDIRDRC